MKQVLKILCASTNRFPIRHSFLEEVMCRGLTSRGHLVTWILQTEEARAGFEQRSWQGCNVWLMPSRLRSSFVNQIANFVKKPFDSSRILQTIIEQDGVPDIIQIRNDWLIACWALIMRRRFKFPVIFQYSFPIPQEHYERARIAKGLSALVFRIRGHLEWIFLKFVMKHADHTLPISNSMKNNLIRSGIDKDKMTPFPLGCAFEKGSGKAMRKISREALGLNLSDPVAIYFGSLSKFRKLGFLFEVMSLVLSKLPSARLIVLGGTPSELNSLQDESIRMGLGKAVIYHENVAREDVPYYIGLADVGISSIPPIPMYINSYPTKLIETLAAGRPVVANREITEQRLLIEESGGGLCVPYKTESFSQALIELLSEPERAKSMGAAGLKYVKEHNSYAKMTIDLENLYFKLLGSS
jgi:glycosyltransferase involved in cell wall biosynthesis